MLQESSGELWGRASARSHLPTVQAFRRGLRPGERGIEFYTEVTPALDHPVQVKWRPGTAGVTTDGEWAKITIVVTRNTQVDRS